MHHGMRLVLLCILRARNIRRLLSSAALSETREIMARIVQRLMPLLIQDRDSAAAIAAPIPLASVVEAVALRAMGNAIVIRIRPGRPIRRITSVLAMQAVRRARAAPSNVIASATRLAQAVPHLPRIALHNQHIPGPLQGKIARAQVDPPAMAVDVPAMVPDPVALDLPRPPNARRSDARQL